MEPRTKRTAKRKKKADTLQIIRLIVQIAFFIFLPALYINAFFQLKLVFVSITGGSFDLVALLPQIIELIAVVPATILLGRFFCGWMCAFGAFGDFIYKIVQKLFHIRFRISERADHALKFIKYGMLAFTVIFLWTLDIPGLASASPWDVFGMIATVGSAPAIGYVLANLTLGFIFFALIAVGSAFIQRFFCRYICPLGAAFSIFSVFKLTRINRQSTDCGKCRVCTNACAMGIPVYKGKSVHTGECIECFQCVSACPRGNVSYSLAGSNVRPLLAGTMAAITITGAYGFAGLAFAAPQTNEAAVQIEATVDTDTDDTVSGEAQLKPEATPSASDGTLSNTGKRNRGSRVDTATSSTAADTQSSVSSSDTTTTDSSTTTDPAASAASSIYADGTYTGTGTGFRGATTQVSVTISGDVITDITPLSTGDDAPYFDRAFSSVCTDIISCQCSSVDAVSGATYSSIGIMDAVQDALNQAAI